MLQGNIHLHIEPVQRSEGQSLIVRVAYQTASALRNPLTQKRHNFKYKASEIGGTLLITPQGETSKRKAIASFWENVERHHKRKDAIPGRTFSVALPCELSKEENLLLMYAYGRWLSKTYGIGVQVTAHLLDSNNPHFHITISSCSVMPDGTLGKKVRELDPIAMQHDHRVSPAESLRAKWADMVNKAYAENGVAEHVDHRSYERRGIGKISTVHEGIWHYAPCPVNSPVTLNATIQQYNQAVQEEKDLARQKEDIEKKLTALQHDDSVSKVTTSKHALEHTPKSDMSKQSSGNSDKATVSAPISRPIDASKPDEQKRVMPRVAGHPAGREKLALQKTGDKVAANSASQPARKSVEQTAKPKEVKPVSASEKISSNSSKGNPALEKIAAQPSSPQKTPDSQDPQGAWYSRAWAIIVRYASTMPKTDRETELRGACLKFCQKNPTVTSRHIEKVLALHSKSTAEEQKRVVARVAEYIAGRETRPLNGETHKNRAEGNTQRTLTPSAHSRETAGQKPASPSSQPAGTPTEHTSAPVEVTPVTASEKVSSNSLKGNPTMGKAAAQVSSPQNAPTPQVQQAPWHSRAWDMIVNVARTMPRTDPETELRGACLQFCKKYPKVTANYIEQVLSLHSKRTPEEQKRVVASVAEHIAGRDQQPLVESIQKKSGDGGTPKTENAHSQSRVAAMSKPEAATPQQPSRMETPQSKEGSVQAIAETEVVPPSSGTRQAEVSDEHIDPKAPSSTISRNENDTGDSIGREIRSALQSYCTMLAGKAEMAEAYGQVKRRDLIHALLHAPVGEQIAGLRKWLSREHPDVAQEIGKRLTFARRAHENKERLHRLENVFRYLPSDFIRNRLGIEMQEGSNDAVAGVAAAKDCTRFEAVKMLTSVLPDLMRLGQDGCGKDTTCQDRMAIHTQRMQAITPQQEEEHAIQPE